MTQDVFQKALERFSDAQEASREQRARMLEDAKFSNPADPQQWDDLAKRIRENGPNGARPCLTLDHTNQYIRQVVNDARQNKPGLEAFPASGGARIKTAQAIEGMFRHIEYRSRAQIAYDTAVEHAARMGLGWIRVLPEVIDPELNFQEIRIQRIHDPLSITTDPDWTEPDGTDITYGFVEAQIAREEFKRRYPKADQTSWENNRTAGWFNERTMRIAEYLEVIDEKVNSLAIELADGLKRTVSEEDYWKTAKEVGYQPMVTNQFKAKKRRVVWRIINGVEVLEEQDFPSRWTGLVPVIGSEVWIEGKRYLSGMVRSMMEAQRAYNYERSAWVEAVALQPKAPYLASAEAIEDHEDKWNSANRTSHAYLPWNAYDDEGRQLPKPERSRPPDLPAAFAQGAQFADSDIQASVGMYRASLGAPTAEHSGIAIRQKQQEGDTANFHYMDNLARSIEMVGRIVVDMLPRLYDVPREARILGVDGEAKPIRIDPEGEAHSQRQDGEQTINLGTGTYDVRVKAGPSYTTLRQEASEQIGELMKGDPALAAAVAPIWAQMQDWPQADKLSKALLAMAPPPVQQALQEGEGGDDPEAIKQKLMQCQQQLEHMQKMVEMAGEQLKQAQDTQEKNHNDALAKTAQLNIDQYRAVTERMKVLAPALSAPAVDTIGQELMAEVGAELPGSPMSVTGGESPLAPEPPAPPGEPTDDTSTEPPPGGFSSSEAPQ